MVSITPEADARLRKGDHGKPWNASLMLEEAIWARAKQDDNTTKTEYAERAAAKARAAAEAEFEKQAAQQAGMRAPYEERLNSLELLWRQAVKENGIGSHEEIDVSKAILALIAEAKTKGVTLVKPEYVQT